MWEATDWNDFHGVFSWGTQISMEERERNDTYRGMSAAEIVALTRITRITWIHP